MGWRGSVEVKNNKIPTDMIDTRDFSFYLA